VARRSARHTLLADAATAALIAGKAATTWCWRDR
jgi:hypothetical protein